MIQIGEVNLLKDIYDEIIVPMAVYNELLVFDSNSLLVKEQLHQDWFKIETVVKDSIYLSLSIELDIGEVEAITLAGGGSNPLMFASILSGFQNLTGFYPRF